MKTKITHRQEKVLYQVVEELKLAHDWSEQGCLYPSGLFIDAVAGQLEAAFPNIDGYDLQQEITTYFDKYGWSIFAKYIIEECRDKWLFNCERRGFRERIYGAYMTWDDVGRDWVIDKLDGIKQRVTKVIRRNKGELQS